MAIWEPMTIYDQIKKAKELRIQAAELIKTAEKYEECVKEWEDEIAEVAKKAFDQYQKDNKPKDVL